MKHLSFLLICSFIVFKVPAQISFVGDYDPVYIHNSEIELMEAGGLLYFAEGGKLWYTDGQGVNLVKSFGNPLYALTDFDNKLYFVADDSTTGNELWVCDNGVASLVKDINPGTGNGVLDNESAFMLKMLNGKLYFVGYDSADSELWESDGTAAGTKLAFDMDPTPGVSNVAFPYETFEVANGKLFFEALDANKVYGVYASDGTLAGTHLVYNVTSFLDNFVSDGNRIYFHADKFLFASDGTPSGTQVILTNINILLRGYTGLNGKTILSVVNSLWCSLYQTDGTQGGTFSILDTAGIALNTPYNGALFVTNYNGKLYFNRFGELWETDGSPSGAKKALNLPFSNQSNLRRLYVLGNKLLFAARDTFRNEVWMSDGTQQGTVKIDYPGADPTTVTPPFMAPVSRFYLYNDRLYFTNSYKNDIGMALYSIAISDITNVEQHAAVKKHIAVYPNPSSDILYIQSGDRQLQKVEIYDITGKLINVIINSDNQSVMQCQLNGLSNGQYMLKAYDGEQVATQKFVISR